MQCGLTSRPSRAIDDLKYERKKAAVKGGLEGISDDEAFAEIQGRRLGAPKD